MGGAPRTVLVYSGLELLGDGLIKLPFLRALRHAFPESHITWLAGKGRSVYAGVLAPLVAGLVDEVIDNADIGTGPAELLRRPLMGRPFDLVIDTQRRLLTTLILKRLRHRRFISACGGYALSDAKPADGRRPAAMIRQLLDLVELASGKEARPEAPLTLDTDLVDRAAALLPTAAYVGLAPGAGGRHKCWPLGRYVELGRRLVARGFVPVVILGPAEAEWADEVRKSLPEALLPLQQAGDAPPLLTIALATRLAAAVANDSGVGHMLAAGGAPLVSLFGPTSPAKFAPLVVQGRVVSAQSFGAAEMAAIPVAAVEQAVLELAALPQPAMAGATA